MGDVLQALAAISDATEHREDLEIDWVVDEHFQEIPLLHPKVSSVIITNHRTWRKKPFSSSKEIFTFIRKLRKKRYDLIIDAQGNWKSALITLFSKGLKVGLDRFSVREYIAHFAYSIKHSVSKKQHAVEHLRELLAKALGYEKPKTTPNFGIQIPSPTLNRDLQLPEEYYVCIHAASWDTKLWPESSFSDLIKQLDAPVLLFWGSKKEKLRAEKIGKHLPHVHILPKRSLSQITLILAKAKAVISVDTGLGHLSAALGVPTVGLHGPTDPKRIGSLGPKTRHLYPSVPCFPCHKNRCYYQGTYQKSPYCFQQISPDHVLMALEELLS